MSSHTPRPIIMGRRGVVTSGHYLSTEAGLRMLHAGGNAIDAAAAMAFCLHLLEPHQNGIGGEVPMLIHSAREGKTVAISGMGWSAASLTIEWCREHGIDMIPGDGYLPACVPAAVGTWAEALKRFGTMTFGDVLQPAIELAEDGYPMYAHLREHIVANRRTFTDLYPTTGAIYLSEGAPVAIGTLFRNTQMARTLRTMADAEAEAGGSRITGIEAACNSFYRGPIAERIVDFINRHPVEDASGSAHTGLLNASDFADWQATVEEPVSYTYRGLDVHKCPSWTQGPVFVQQLALLHGLDVATLGQNSADYLHTIIEVAKLAFADREAYYGDPTFDDVPSETLLCEDYNVPRRAMIEAHASMDIRPGDAGRGDVSYARRAVLDDNRMALGVTNIQAGRDTTDPHAGDTTHLDAADAEGNMIAATPSGGWFATSPVIEGLGFPLGTRGQMFYLNAVRPNALAGRKRPRATLTPTLVTQQGRPIMGFGTPGGDMQDQITLQFFLNHVDFGMDLQDAIDAPTVVSHHVPSSFYPREAMTGAVTMEGRHDAAVSEALRQRGHKVEITGDWALGRVQAVKIDHERQVLHVATSPRDRVGYGMGW